MNIVSNTAQSGVQMKFRAKLMLSTALAAMSVTAAMPVFAAEDGATAEAPQGQAPVSELVVTGARMQGLEQAVDAGPLGGKAILDTPFSVTVVDAEEIELRQPQSIGQLFINDPSVFSFATAGTVNWWGLQIRGLGVRNYYVDDVPLVLYWGGDYPLESVESVQALKGANGFMNGFGSPGGAISYRTKRPTEKVEVSTDIGWRGVSVISGGLDAGGPVTDKLGVRLVIAGDKGEEYNGAEVTRGLVSIAADYEITPTLTWRNNVTFEDYELRDEPFHLYWSDYKDDRLPSIPGSFDNLRIDNSAYGYDLWTATSSLEWQINADWSVDLSQGYTRKRHRSNKLFAYMQNEQGDYEAYRYQFGELDVVHFTQAIVQGEVTTGPIRHELVVGASHQIYESDFGFNGWDYQFTGNLFQRPTFSLPGSANYGIEGSPYKERQDAIFASDTLHFGAHWQAIFGLRYTEYDLEDVDGNPATASGYHTDALTPTVALLYKPTARTTFYASYVESMEGGSVIQDPMYANIGDVLDATVSKQYEIGAKHDGERLSLTAAAFRLERAATIDQDVGGLTYLRQDGLTLYDGVEASGQYRVTEDLTLGLGAIYLDASLEDVTPPTPPNPDIRGNRPAEASKWQVVANFEYDVRAIAGLSLHGNVRYFGEAPTSDANDLIIPDYTLVGVGFQYRTEIGGRPVAFTGNINNLLNEQYWGLQNFGESINASLGVKVDW